LRGPGEAALREERESGGERREHEREGEELPEVDREVTPAEVLRVGRPLEDSEALSPGADRTHVRLRILARRGLSGKDPPGEQEGRRHDRREGERGGEKDRPDEAEAGEVARGRRSDQ